LRINNEMRLRCGRSSDLGPIEHPGLNDRTRPIRVGAQYYSCTFERMRIQRFKPDNRFDRVALAI